MKRPHFHPQKCKVCGRGEPEVPRISQTGLCIDHAKAIFEANLDQLRAHDGPWFNHWRRSMALSVGAILIDDVERLLPDDG